MILAVVLSAAAVVAADAGISLCRSGNPPSNLCVGRISPREGERGFRSTNISRGRGKDAFGSRGALGDPRRSRRVGL